MIADTPASTVHTATFGWNALDWALAAIVVLSAIRGLFRGLLQTLFGLAGLICGMVIAAWEYAAATHWMVSHGWISSPIIAAVVCYVGIAAGVALAFAIAGALARKTAHAVGLGVADRLLGGALGVVRGALIGAVIVLTARSWKPTPEVAKTSRLSSYFLDAAHAVSFVVPHTLR